MKKVNWSRAGKIARNLLKAVINGSIVMKLDRFLPHMLVTVALLVVCIFTNLKIDETMVEREKGRLALEQAKICLSQKVCQLAQMRQVNNVVQMLEENGMDIRMPEKPATIIKTR